MAKTAKAVLLQMAHCRVLFWLPAHALRGLIPGSRKMCLLCVYFVYSSISRGFFRAGRGGDRYLLRCIGGRPQNTKFPYMQMKNTIYLLSSVISSRLCALKSSTDYLNLYTVQNRTELVVFFAEKRQI